MESQFQGHGFSSTSSSQFATDLQSLLGPDGEPDSLFLEESWILGLTAAAENLQRRRHGRAERERQNLSFRELNSLGSILMMPENDWSTDSLLSERTATIARQYAGLAKASFDDELTSEIIYPATAEQAGEGFGIEADCTREQIKVAYRRMVSQWHPDRFENSNEAVRRHATEKMAAINEAYRLLSNGLTREAA